MVVSEFAKLFDSSDEAVVAINNGKIAYSNPAAKMRLGQLLNTSPDTLFSDETEFSTEYNGISYRVTMREAFDHRIYTLSPVFKPEDDILYHFSFKLKEQLASLKLSCNILMPHVENIADEKTIEYFRHIAKTSFVLHRMAGNLGFFQSFDSRSFLPASFDIAACVRDITESVPVFVGDRCPALVFNCDEQGITLQGDRDKIELMLFQLLSNSIKNTPADGTITITLKRNGEKIVLTVSDTGRGISPEQMEKIWEPGNVNLTPENGVGVGLPIVSHIVKLHGGHALLTSTNKGTVVTVSLPVSQPNADGMNILSAKYDSGLSDLMLQLSDVIPVENFRSRFMD